MIFQGSPELVLTYLGARHGDEESQVTNEESGMPPGDRIYLAACAKINSTRPAKSQRSNVFLLCLTLALCSVLCYCDGVLINDKD